MIAKKPKSLWRFLPLLLLVFLLAGFLYVIFFINRVSVLQISDVSTKTTYSCAEGLVQSCSIGICSGTMECIGGLWTGCHISGVICSPGSTRPCIKNSCNVAYQTCNSCGTGYDACITYSTTG